MAFEILPLGVNDVPESFAVAGDAFATFNRIIFDPYPLTAESTDYLMGRRIEGFSSMPQQYGFKAVDTETGRIVGVSRWSIQLYDTRLERSLKEEVDARLQPEIPELRRDVARQFYTMLHQGKRQALGIRDDGNIASIRQHIELQTLYTHPSYQRRGIASALLVWGVDEADRLGLIVYLSASTEGRALYEKFGFECVSTFTMGVHKDANDDTQEFTVWYLLFYVIFSANANPDYATVP